MIWSRRGENSVRSLPATSLRSLNRPGLLGRIAFFVLSIMPGMSGSNIAVAPLTASNSFAVATAVGCCARAGAVPAMHRNVSTVSARRASLVTVMKSSLRETRSGPLDDAHAVRPCDDSGSRDVNEQAVLDHPGNGGKMPGKQYRLDNPLEREIENPVAGVGDERVALLRAPQWRRP